MQRRIHEVEEREERPEACVEPGAGIPVDGERAGGQDHRLRDEQRDGARPEPGERREQVEDRLEVIAPSTHAIGDDEHRDLRQHGPVSLHDVPEDLNGLPEVERVRAKREVARHDDRAHRQQIQQDAGDDHARRSQGGDPVRRQERADTDDEGERDDEVLGARQRHRAERAAAGREHDDGRGGDRNGEAVERARHAVHGGRP